MQFFIDRKFLLRPLRRCDVKPNEKLHKHNFTFDVAFLEKTKEHRRGTIQQSLSSLVLYHCATFTHKNGTKV